jgi:hypothetical protein
VKFFIQSQSVSISFYQVYEVRVIELQVNILKRVARKPENTLQVMDFKLQGQTDALGTFDCLNNKRTDLNDAEKEDTDRINGSILCSVMELGFVCGRITLEKELALEATTGHRSLEYCLCQTSKSYACHFLLFWDIFSVF